MRRLLRAGLFVSSGIFLGRLAGLFRDISLGSLYGLGSETDLVVFMLSLPDLLVDLLVGGGLGAALVPEFTNRNAEARRALLLRAWLIFGAAFTLICMAIFGLSSTVVRVLAPGFDSTQAALASNLVRYSIWVVPLTILAGISTAYLQAKGSYGVAACGTLIFNLVLIAGLIVTASWARPLQGLALFMISGAAIRWLSQAFVCGPLRPRAFLEGWSLPPGIIRRYIEATLGSGVLLLIPVAARALASLEGPGAIALLNFSLKLVLFPLGICVTVISVVLYPRLSQCATEATTESFANLSRLAMVGTLLLSVGTAVPLVLCADSLSRLAFGYGSMDFESVSKIADLSRLGFLSIPFMGGLAMQASICGARLDMRTPLMASIFAFSAFIGMAWMLRGYGLQGLMTAVILGYVVAHLFAFTLMRRRHGFWPLAGRDGVFVTAATILLLMVGFVARKLADILHVSYVLEIGFVGLMSLITMAILMVINPSLRLLWRG